MAQFQKYNLYWQTTVDAASLELDMIKHGGQWKKQDGTIAGEGLVFHFKEFIRIVWPWVLQHKWFNLILENYVKYRTIVLIGPASSSKTFTSAILVLVDYFAHPDCTTVICCSTTKERLQDRVWADITKLFREAKSQRKWLPGNIIEGRLRIVTDSRKDSPDGRDFRNGCFPTGTLVDTPSGKFPIESLKVGDLVFNAIGVGRIKDTHTRTSDVIIRITLNDGRQIECTEEHPFFTSRGWVKAIDLRVNEMVFSAHGTLQIVRSEADKEKQKQRKYLLLRSLQKQSSVSRVRWAAWRGIPVQKLLHADMLKIRRTTKALPALWKGVQGINKLQPKICRKVLLSRLLGAMGGNSRKTHEGKKEMQTLWENDESSFQSRLLLGSVPESSHDSSVQAMWESIPINSGIPSPRQVSFLRKILQEESDWEGQFSKAGHSNTAGNGSLETIPGVHTSSSHSHRAFNKAQAQTLVSSGHWIPGNKTSRGGRWRDSHNSRKANKGSEKNEHPKFYRVDRVEILEQGSGSGFNPDSKTYLVHNLSVEGHPSYSVNGVIVHNCVGVPCKRGETFVGLADFAGIKNKRVRLLGDELSLLPRAFCDSISNLDKNPDFKCIGLGNPKETTDALGVLGEPAPHLGGWDGGIDQSFGTKTWAIRRDEGIAIQLPGDDSPNLDGQLGIPLISQADMNRDISFYGKESLWYTMMDLGRMPKGQGSRRVLTRQLCLKYNTMDEPVWRDNNLTHIAFLDAAYRGVGGDRCVFGTLTFGYEVPMEKFSLPDSSIAHSMTDKSANRQVIALKEMMVVPIDPSFDEPAEYQIANFVKKQCEERGIPPEDFFYDAGMRTSLVSAFVKVWGAPGETVDFGGSPTDDPVSSDIPISCKDYYSKFVSQLWFSVRMVVEAGQQRGFTEDLIMEFSAREYGKVGGNKTEVEPKEKVKEKTGRSPDLADAYVCGLFGALQRGFHIASLKPPPKQSRNKEDWRTKIRDRAKKLSQAGQLEYAAS